MSGQTDAVDPKLLPDGVFAEVRNGRLPAPGSLRLRRGWRPLPKLDSRTGAAYDAYDLFSYDRSLVAMVRESTSGRAGMGLATYTNTQTARPWTTGSLALLSPVTNVRTAGNVGDGIDPLGASAALTADGAYGVVLEISTTATVYRVFKTATDETVLLAAFSNPTRERKVFSLGATFGMLEATGTDLQLFTLDPAAVGPAWTAGATLGFTNPTIFDVCTARVASPAFFHVAVVTAGATSYARFTTSGVQSGSTKSVALAASVGVAITSDDVLAHILFQPVGLTVSALTCNATTPYATVAGPTVLFGGATVVTRQFSVAYTAAASVFVYAGNLAATAGDTIQGSITTAHTGALERTHSYTAHSAGIVSQDDQTGVGLVYGDVIHGTASVSEYSDVTVPWFAFDYGVARVSGFVRGPSAPGRAASTKAVLSIHPRTAGVSVRLWDLAATDRRPAVAFGPRLYVTGGTLTQWDSVSVQDSGMRPPVVKAVVQSAGAGAIANGTYSYRAVLSWVDPTTNEQMSIVSPALNITYAGANNTGTATVIAPKTLRRFTSVGGLAPVIELYRTEAGPGELFYRIGTASTDAFVDPTTVVDLLADASILTAKRLYTEGENGGLSGVLDWSPPSPSAYVAAMRDRVVIGTAGRAYEVSQAALPDEAARFTQVGVSGGAAFVYTDGVEGTITAVAALDDTIVIGTAQHLYVSSGEGPNLAGIGEFTTPARLPTDTGVTDWRSVLETAEGLWFRGTTTNMYLLPRGQATPTEDRASQSRLGAVTIVGAGYDTTDDVAVWAKSDATTLVRQTDIHQWFSDGLPFTPVALVGHRGALYAVASDGVVWAQSAAVYGDGTSGATAVALRVATGQIAPFGLAGQGRLAVVEILGEYQADATILAELSYDDGLTWTTLGSFAVTGLAVGAAFQRQFHPARQRGDRFRVRATMTPTVSTTEGCRLAGSTLYFTMQSGPTRLDSAKRR